MAARWYVYGVYSAGYLLYIGKGSNNRYRISARKHGGIGGIMESFNREADAFKREIELIAQFSPPLNKSKGGEGNSSQKAILRAKQDARIARQWQRQAYAAADKSATWLNLLAAAAYARCELNSRGIKQWPVEAPAQAQVDPKVDEAIRRLNDWRLFQPPASLRSITCSA